MTNTYIKVGTRVRVYDGSVTSNDHLEVGTYKVEFSPTTGYSLVQTEDLSVGVTRVYGNHHRKAEKVLGMYHRHDRGLGVMLSGDKGQGKTLFMRVLAEQAQLHKLPVVLVTENYGGIASFLDTLGECMIVFDEFEKVFPKEQGSDELNYQNQFLPLFDGASQQRRLYCITVNNLHDLSDYLHNRPGRFHYHLRFDYPDADAIREYLTDQAPAARAVVIDDAVRFANQAKINYDHLRAIAMEINHNPEMPFGELIEDLNIKNTEQPDYNLTVRFTDGSTGVGVINISLTEGQTRSLQLVTPHGRLWSYLTIIRPVMDATGAIQLSNESLVLAESDSNPKLIVDAVSLKLMPQHNYTYRAL